METLHEFSEQIDTNIIEQRVEKLKEEIKDLEQSKKYVEIVKNFMGWISPDKEKFETLFHSGFKLISYSYENCDAEYYMGAEKAAMSFKIGDIAFDYEFSSSSSGKHTDKCIEKLLVTINGVEKTLFCTDNYNSTRSGKKFNNIHLSNSLLIDIAKCLNTSGPIVSVADFLNVILESDHLEAEIDIIYCRESLP